MSRCGAGAGAGGARLGEVTGKTLAGALVSGALCTAAPALYTVTLVSLPAALTAPQPQEAAANRTVPSDPVKEQLDKARRVFFSSSSSFTHCAL